ncbi:MAG: hypothetical protein B7X86_14285 [Sphingobacteriales bacterium 17-39-43]|uniref:hypothetical protein n=1 Tax=Daejeonella sp. TaxID=2805397 RepID=UPI000BC72A22|nr:hypothetical protein [Daejeonella sp.]OYZ30117.1 MAG: hypothetical protein B7Y24_14050 [Sphingobacteriales bacterium 16-39-50]OZA22835.1 MAG: hypothetical protein B7X86_14285 [Sphingobacteriales bacterium 17-39-43]HQT24014.1 hypothetical protein [Daejeonella sp.]HQT58678.1 hypothetical protein [Daejeonella sp.]
MTNTFLNIIIGLCGLALAALPYLNKLSSINLFRRVKYKWVLETVRTTRFKVSVTFLAGLLGIWATIEKDKLADRERANDIAQDKKNQAQRKVQHERDLKQLSEDNLKNFGSGLAKYYLKYDSVSKEIKSVVRDSSKTKIVEANRPELTIGDLKVHVDTNEFISGIIYTATQSAIHKFDGKLYIMVRDRKDSLWYVDLPYNDLFMDLALGTTYLRNQRFIVDDPKEVSKIYYLTLGTYNDGKGNTYHCKLLAAYLVDESQVIGVSKKEYAWVMDTFFKNGIKVN